MVEATDFNMLVAAIILFAGFVSVFAGKLLNNIGKAIKIFENNTNKNELMHINWGVIDVINNFVRMSGPRIMELLKEKTEDGVLTEDEICEIVDDVLDDVQVMLSQKALDSIAHIADDVDEWLKLVIKSKVIGFSEELKFKENNQNNYVPPRIGYTN